MFGKYLQVKIDDDDDGSSSNSNSSNQQQQCIDNTKSGPFLFVFLTHTFFGGGVFVATFALECCCSHFTNQDSRPP